MKAEAKSRRRLLCIACAGSILILGFLAFYEFRLRLPMGCGPAGPAVKRKLFQQTWSTQDVLFIGMGDSVTAGFGARPGKSYFDRMVKNPTGESSELEGLCLRSVFPKLTATNLAVSGSTSVQHFKTQFPRLAGLATNARVIIVMTTGGNDLIHNYGRTPPREHAMYGADMAQAKQWIEAFEKRLETMNGQFDVFFPNGWDLFLADIYDPTDGVGDPERAGLPKWRDNQPLLKAYNDVIANFARTHPRVHLVKIHDAFLGHGIHCREFWRGSYQKDDPHYWYHENLEDPNDRGYDALRCLFLNRCAEVFSTSERASDGSPMAGKTVHTEQLSHRLSRR